MARRPESVDYSPMVRAVPAAQTISPVAAAQAAGGIAAGAAEVAEFAAGWMQRRADRNQEAQVSDAVLRVTDQLQNLRVELESDPDTLKRHEKFRAKADELVSKEMAGLGYQKHRDDFKVRANRLSATLGLDVKLGAAAEEKELNRLKLDDNNSDLLNKALAAPRGSPERAQYLENAKANIRGAVEVGTISAVQARTRERQQLASFEAADAGDLLHKSPAAAIKALRDPAQYTYLDAPARQRLITMAEQRAESQGVQARAEFNSDFTLYTQARQAGQPVSAEIEENLARRSKALGGVQAKHFDVTKTFYDRVDSYAGKSLPDLRAAVTDLDSGDLKDKQVGRAVQKIVVDETREKGRQLKDQLGDWQKLREAGERPDTLPAILKLAEEVGGESTKASIEALDRRYDRINDARRNAPAAEVREKIANIQGARKADQGGQLALDDLYEIGALQHVLDAKEKEAKADSAAYVIKYYPTVAEAFAKLGPQSTAEDFNRAASSLIAAQDREGIPRQILTRPVAERLEAKLNHADPAVRQEAARDARATFGPALWPLIKQQLNKGANIPADVEVLASLPPTARVDAAKISEGFKLKEEEWAKQLGADKRSLDDKVRDGGADIWQSFARTPGGPPVSEQFITAARRVAYVNRAQGQSVGDASRNALDEVFNRHWLLVDGVRVPKIDGQPVVEPDRLRTMQRLYVRGVEKMDLLDPESPALANLTPEQRKGQLARAVQSFGFWVSDADEKGAYLFAGPGQPVRLSDGKPVYIPFSELQGANWEPAQKRAREAFGGRRL